MLDFWAPNGSVELTVYAHSLDFGKKAYGNLVELAHLQHAVAAELGLPVGSSTVLVKSAHVYEPEWELMARLVREAGIAAGDLTTTHGALSETSWLRATSAVFGRRSAARLGRTHSDGKDRRTHAATGPDPAQASAASSVISGTPASAFETGQFAFASAAASTKAAAPTPGTRPRTVSATFVIPSPGTKVTVARVELVGRRAGLGERVRE